QSNIGLSRQTRPRKFFYSPHAAKLYRPKDTTSDGRTVRERVDIKSRLYVHKIRKYKLLPFPLSESTAPIPISKPLLPISKRLRLVRTIRNSSTGQPSLERLGDIWFCCEEFTYPFRAGRLGGNIA